MHSDSDVFEFVILNDASEDDRRKTEGYIAHKWGIAAHLPVDHPHHQQAPLTPEAPAIATLEGVASDLEGEPLTVAWSLVSGPGAVVFADLTSPGTTAAFSTAGVYVLRLIVADGLSTNSDEVTITVEAPAADPKTYPTVDPWPLAGSLTEGSPLSSTTLSGGAASVAGRFAFTNPDTVLPAGVHAVDVTFTPDDSTQFHTVHATILLTVRTAFESWAGTGGVTFSGDANGDGVADGMAWLLGADDPAQDARALLPAFRQTNGAFEATFTMLNQAARGRTILVWQYGTDLGTWTTVTIPEATGMHDGVEFVITPLEGVNQVVARIPTSVAAPNRVFFRLSGAELPESHPP